MSAADSDLIKFYLALEHNLFPTIASAKILSPLMYSQPSSMQTPIPHFISCLVFVRMLWPPLAQMLRDNHQSALLMVYCTELCCAALTSYLEWCSFCYARRGT